MISHAIYEGLYLRMLQKEMGVDVEEEGTLLVHAGRQPVKYQNNKESVVP